jgi:methylated-DNA-[protein]-cysteine S-methyltransferase
VPSGKVTTYAAIAKSLNSRAYRAVGSAMRANTDQKIPCHRVICSDGRVGNYNRGQKLKIRILKKEGVTVMNGRISLDTYEAKLKS